MQGTILIVDGVSTSRIILRVQLSAAWYHVVQAEGMAGIAALVRRTEPDLIVTAMSLPDGDALALRELLQSDPALASIPIVAITAENDRAARLRALQAGIDDVLSQPVDDLLLQARIRSLIRAGYSAEDLRLPNSPPEVQELAEPATGFEPAPVAARVALVTRRADTAALWKSRLIERVPHRLSSCQIGNIHALMREPGPDAVVVELPDGDAPATEAGLRLLADLRARGVTRDSAVIAVPNPGNARLAAEALDRGAHDVTTGGFCVEELALRLAAQLRRKARSDRLRATLRDGLRAAVLDPMTGLYNRRYALPQLGRIAHAAADTGTRFAVMLADLDHFKRINDRYGHQTGDEVLIEAAHRLRGQLRPQDMIARVGGEEFMIVMPDTDRAAAGATADRLCRQINAAPFRVPGPGGPIPVTISIGVAVSPGPDMPVGDPDQSLSRLISRADRALYAAKDAGRNQVTLDRAAA